MNNKSSKILLTFLLIPVFGEATEGNTQSMATDTAESAFLGDLPKGASTLADLGIVNTEDNTTNWLAAQKAKNIDESYAAEPAKNTDGDYMPADEEASTTPEASDTTIGTSDQGTQSNATSYTQEDMDAATALTEEAQAKSQQSQTLFNEYFNNSERLKKESEELQSALHKAENRMADLNRRIDELQVNNSGLSDQLDHKQREAKEALARVQKEANDLRAALKAKQTITLNLKNQLYLLQLQLEKQNQLLTHRTNKLSELREDIKHKEQVINASIKNYQEFVKLMVNNINHDILNKITKEFPFLASINHPFN